MDDSVSRRIVDQRIRNRIMDLMDALADGDDWARRIGFAGYFNFFHDWVPHRDDPQSPMPETMTAEEVACLREVSRMMDDACDATPSVDEMTLDEFIATGWPGRIQEAARRAFAVMSRRGPFREDREENEPPPA